mmetsp:Transcript_50332/g.115499  ORF Transcript_50332/g.115499 Transcript_50332/m.115499 type:complete len:146 (-) Transcript_50332:37-474(-)|eukprot:CAMPEP_0179974028 /NCGR_PEP_ID=MMETSP0983-20121128/37787_1 /TAXON_ID=483367 /ORGANISM="non described non described, Strain CCMP 2436" /LENGTH=145 /DNA_ID=CAMNT_0021890081 /DNA_START=758 /DNA_END=1195 /DNA_ORIENTATION=+
MSQIHYCHWFWPAPLPSPNYSATRMLVGLPCGWTPKHPGEALAAYETRSTAEDAALVPAALRALRDEERTGYVGLSSRFEESVRAFAQFANIQLIQRDFAHMRSRSIPAMIHQEARAMLQNFKFVDQEVYDEAVRLFERRLASCA